MTFLAPAFLFGLLAVAVPVFVHLRRRRTRERHVFPSLMFLEQVPHATIRRRRLRDLLLFALRIGAVVLLSLAFAQPAFRNAGPAGAGEEARHLFLLVDRSASMDLGGRWDRALEASSSRLAGLRPGDLATLALFDEEVEVVAVGERDQGAVRRALEDAAPRERPTSLTGGLRVLRPLVLDALEDPDGAGAVEVVLVSDFQRAGVGDLEDLRLPAGTELELVDVADGDPLPANAWVQDVELQRGGDVADVAGREAVGVVATVARQLDETAAAPEPASLRVTLSLDGRELQTRIAEFEGRSTTVRFDPVALDAERTARGRVSIPADAFPADDEFFFTASATDALPVALVEGRGRADGLYVRRALESSTAPRYRVLRTGPEDLGPRLLSDVAAVVVPDVGVLQEASADALRRFVESGGGLLIGYGRASVSRRFPEWLDFGTGEPPVQVRSGRRLATVRADHPLFAGLEQQNIGLAPFFRHAVLAEPSQAEDGARVLARFDDGMPALLETPHGAGRILVFASSLDTDWNDFPRQALFVAWMDRMARHLGSFRPAREWYRVGEPAVLPLPAETGSDWLLTPENGEPETLRLDASDLERGEMLVVFDRSGYSSLRPTGSDPAEARWFAGNLPRTESDLRAADTAVLEARLAPEAEQRPRAAGAVGSDAPTSFWWLILYAALLLLVSEVFVANRRPILRSPLGVATGAAGRSPSVGSDGSQ